MAKLERKTDQLMERLVEADSPALVRAYETQVRKLEEEKTALAERIANCGRPLTSFDETYRTAMKFLGSPYDLWASGVTEYQKMVLRLTFAHNLVYDREEGYRTPAMTLPFKVFPGACTGNQDLVELRGIEPLTSSLRTTRSPN